jgi:hypothetical protein
MRWDAARAASKRTPRWDGKLSTKVVVGFDPRDVHAHDIHCSECSYYVCGETCPRVVETRREQEAARIRDHIAEHRRLLLEGVERVSEPLALDSHEMHKRLYEAEKARQADQDRCAAARARTRDIIENGYGYDKPSTAGETALGKIAQPFPCVFCQQTGVHDCPGGEYVQDRSDTAFSLAVTTGRMFPGSVDAEFTRGMRRI